MPTIATFMQFLPAGFKGRTYRSTDSTVYCVVEGNGVAHVGDDAFAFEPHDVFVAPSWAPARLDAESDAVLSSYSDRMPVQKKTAQAGEGLSGKSELFATMRSVLQRCGATQNE